MSLVFKKKGCELGTIKDYGVYGKYKKTEDGWKRIKNGYPKFRRTLHFKRMKEFLLSQGFGEGFIDSRSSKQLRIYMKSHDLTDEFNLWNEENENGKKI